MPLYDFQCKTCGSAFEELVRGSLDQADLACPRCESPEIVREISLIAPRSREAPPTRLSAASSCGTGT
jgi:putative FmdB family regulatory protein